MNRPAALGMFRLGASDSPAQMHTSSGDRMKANPLLTRAVQNARNFPVFPVVAYGMKAPGCCQYRNPNRSWFGPPPKKSTTPRMMRPIIAIILIEANQNSDSPYQETTKTFRITHTGISQWGESAKADLALPEHLPANMMVIHTATLTDVVQYWITTEAADISAATSIE